MVLAAEIGLDVAKTEIDDIDGQKFLQVARYDRQADMTGIFQRIHQEDFCQALAIPPELKYQQEGGPKRLQKKTVLQSLHWNGQV